MHSIRMKSRERLLTALNRQEPDRVPLDIGSTQVTGIHAIAYRGLCETLGLPLDGVELCDSIQQLAPKTRLFFHSCGNVRRNVEALAPGGGYVFSPVHNIQADVPLQNLIAMWEAWQEYGAYP
jgi:uroporphyrinogen-III decarboxylase